MHGSQCLWNGRRGRQGRHGDVMEQGVEPPTTGEHHLGSIIRPWQRAKLTKAWQTIRKDAFKIKCRHAGWEGQRNDGVCNWDMCVIRVVNLNISRRWGKLRGSAREGLIASVRRRRQFHPNVFVPNVWVQFFVFLQSLLCRGCDLNWRPRVTGCSSG
jgi:hypothetical protein